MSEITYWNTVLLRQGRIDCFSRFLPVLYFYNFFVICPITFFPSKALISYIINK